MIKLTIDKDQEILYLVINNLMLSLDVQVDTDLEALEATLSEKQAWQLTDLIQAELIRMGRARIKIDIETQSERPETCPPFKNYVDAMLDFINFIRDEYNEVIKPYYVDVVGKRKLQQLEDNAELMKYAGAKDHNSCKIETAITQKDIETVVTPEYVAKVKAEEENIRKHLDYIRKSGNVCVCRVCEKSAETQTSLKKLHAHLELNKKYGTVCVCPLCEDYNKEKYDRIAVAKKASRQKGDYVCTNKCGEY